MSKREGWYFNREINQSSQMSSHMERRYLKVLNGVMRVKECFPVDFTVATFRGTEKEATPNWKPSLLG